MGEEDALDYSRYPGKPQWKMQYGCQVIWKDHASAGVSARALENWPRSANWLDFDTDQHRERFVDHYRHDYGSGPELQRDIEKIVLGVRLVAATEWEVERG
jgi:hypothetical protein